MASDYEIEVDGKTYPVFYPDYPRRSVPEQADDVVSQAETVNDGVNLFLNGGTAREAGLRVGKYWEFTHQNPDSTPAELDAAWDRTIRGGESFHPSYTRQQFYEPGGPVETETETVRNLPAVSFIDSLIKGPAPVKGPRIDWVLLCLAATVGGALVGACGLVALYVLR